MKVRLTRNLIRAAEPAAEGDRFLWDSEQLGFGIRIKESGIKTYVFSYSLPGWRSPKRVTVGRVADMNLEQARANTRMLRERVLLGVDPKDVSREREALPSVADLVERFLTEHVAKKLRPTTARGYRQLLGALPRSFLQRKVDEVTGDHVARLHGSMHETPYLANRTLAVLRKMFALAERWHLRPRFSNPASGHDPYPERLDRGSRLSDDQLRRVGEALEAMEREGRFDPFTFGLLRLNLLTGWRPIEVRSMRWEEVDFKRRVVTLRETKTGTRSGFLGKPAAELLVSLPRLSDSPFCFPGRKPDAPLREPKRLWELVQERAELPSHLRFYDLVRHTFNTVAQEVGVAPEMVRVLVGHVPASISDRYTHYALARTLEAADLAAGAIVKLLRGETIGEPEEPAA